MDFNFPKNIFFCIGAQKAATTTLNDILSNHTDICLPNQKETHFFRDDHLYNKGIEFYIKNFFNINNNTKIVGEIDPEYLYHKNVPKRLHKFFPQSKIIIMLRNPIYRAFSHYKMIVSRGQETKKFMQAIKTEPERIKKNFMNNVRYSYTSRGYYSKQISLYLQYFNKNQIKIVLFEDFINDIEFHINDICDFLQIKRINKFDKIKSNPSTKPRIAKLAKFFYNENYLKSLLRPIYKKSKSFNILYNFLKNLNAYKDNSKISESEKIYLKNLYNYELVKLSKLINIKLDSWD